VRQSAFFGIGAYAAALTFTHFGFSTEMALLALVAGVAVSAAVAAIVGGFLLARRVFALRCDCNAGATDHRGAAALYGRNLHRVIRAVVGFEAFDLSVEAWFWIRIGSRSSDSRRVVSR